MKIEKLMLAYNSRCAYCGVITVRQEPTPKGIPPHPHSATRDHFIPKSKGGGAGKNLVLSCYTCNLAKGQALHPHRPSPWSYVPKGYKLITIFGVEIIFRKRLKSNPTTNKE